MLYCWQTSAMKREITVWKWMKFTIWLNTEVRRPSACWLKSLSVSNHLIVGLLNYTVIMIVNTLLKFQSKNVTIFSSFISNIVVLKHRVCVVCVPTLYAFSAFRPHFIAKRGESMASYIYFSTTSENMFSWI